ncbi:rhomboid family intramembrane serine protease [Clostridium thermarum]|uniref:rhomboid family intramembrane serine protease n=1 Tax=Clostridium thermarum TaxID=1716543 RepID=UPI00111CF36D|nr:rhomboid family intramembrane serine protease [Clostridium thermarum]
MLKRIKYNSPVILTFTLISFFALILGEITDRASTYLLFSVYRSSLTDFFFYIRLFGHVLGHADMQHFVNNFIIILLIGPMLEEKYGGKSLMTMISITAVITGLLNIILFDTALLGASGIVFMMILLSSFVNIERGKVPLTFIVIVCIFIGREVIDGIFSSDNISQLTHIVGGICGAYFGFIKKWNR